MKTTKPFSYAGFTGKAFLVALLIFMAEGIYYQVNPPKDVPFHPAPRTEISKCAVLYQDDLGHIVCGKETVTPATMRALLR